MASTDGKSVYVNITELPQIFDINNGDILLVETSNGTQILDFENFIITLDNTTFGDTITTNTDNIDTLSASIVSLSSTVGSEITDNIDTLSASIVSLSATSSDINTLNSSVTALSSTVITSQTKCVFTIPSYGQNDPVILNSNNVEDVTIQTATSAVRITFNTPFSDSDYVVSTTVEDATNTTFVNIVSSTESFIELMVRDIDTTTLFKTAAKVHFRAETF